jgi:hypothetical protein
VTVTTPESIDDVRRRHGAQAGKVLHDLQAEESLIGAMLLSAEAVVTAVGLVSPDDFYKPAHGHIFEAVQTLHAQGRPADPVTVADQLRRAGRLEEVGGPGILISLQAGTPAIGNAGRYAEIVRDHSRDRSVAQASGEVREALLTGADPAPALDRLMAAVAARSADGAGGLRSAVVRGDAILDLPSPAPLVAGMLDLDTLALLYGPSGSTKTFVALDLALSVATGTWWMGRAVEAGPVLYVVAEGLGGLGARVEAWQHQRQVWTCGDVAWLPMAVSLIDRTAAAALAELAAEVKPRLVVVDTLARCMVGGDENTARDVGVAVEGAEALRRASGACVLLVHHSGKDETAGARGSSALRAAVATEIECRHAEGLTTLRQTKQREHEAAEPLRLTLVPVGESCALERYRGEDDTLPAGAVQLLAELAAIADADGVSSTVWMESSGVAHRSFHRWKKRLLDEDYCHKKGERAQARFTVSDLGKRLLDG